jgi:ankyrin repeat protein
MTTDAIADRHAQVGNTVAFASTGSTVSTGAPADSLMVTDTIANLHAQIGTAVASSSPVRSVVGTTGFDNRSGNEFFAMAMYNPFLWWWQTALVVGRDLSSRGQLDASALVCGSVFALGGLASHGRCKTEIEPTMIQELFDIILKNGGHKTLNWPDTSDGYTPLLRAIVCDSNLAAELLIACSETDLNHQSTKSYKSYTALMLAIERGNMRIIECLLSQTPRLKLELTDSDGQTALQILSHNSRYRGEALTKLQTAFAAAQHGTYVVRKEAFSQVGRLSEEKRVEINTAIVIGLCCGSQWMWEEALKWVRQYPTALDFSRPYMTYNVLLALSDHASVNWESGSKERSTITELFHAFVAAGAKINCRSTSEYSPLMFACTTGSDIAVELLCEHPDTDLNYQNTQFMNRTAIMMAITKAKYKIVEWMVTNCVPAMDLTLVDSHGKTAEQYLPEYFAAPDLQRLNKVFTSANAKLTIYASLASNTIAMNLAPNMPKELILIILGYANLPNARTY